MSKKVISTQHLDYLQRSDVPFDDFANSDCITRAIKSTQKLWHIQGVGKIDKIPKQLKEKDIKSPCQDLIVGLNGLKIPMAFYIQGSKSGVNLNWGTWERDNGQPNDSNSSNFKQEMLKTSLNAMYPNISLDPVSFNGRKFSKVGFSLGIPSINTFNPVDGSMAIDRLIRAMVDSNWAVLILAEIAEENAVSQLRGNLIEEIRRIQNAKQTNQAPLPLIEHYEELLGESLKNFTKGIAYGSWRVGVYLMGDDISYSRLASLWRGLFTGEKSLLEPIRNWNFPVAKDWAKNWVLPDNPATSGPGFFRHPLAFQTILTSEQLGAYYHLPLIETPGFSITTVPDFDTVPQVVSSEKTITLGQVMKHKRLVEQTYDIELNKLTKHVFVAGVTGAGKTNTIFHILKEATNKGVPFLIIEPAKTEYRALLKDSVLEGKLRVYTCGSELISPFRLNPFEILPGASVSVHIDLLRSVFAASFGLWNPLPQILEQCLHEIYKDRGWDIVNNKNTRLDDPADLNLTFPTLTDLAAKVEQVTKSLGYEERVTADLRAALLTRITSLRTGGKGRLFDVQQSLPMDTLLSHPTVLELEALGDDDDKAFLMGLILIRLVAFRRQQLQVENLQHILVFEEAHRLLANVGTGGKQEDANPRGKAVETFSNLLSEIRAYGQGVLIADQVPVKLAPDVIKNTNLKIAHRIVAADDRKVMGGAMAMDEKKSQSLGILSVGEAVLFNEGDDAPLLVKMKYSKVDGKPISDIQVAEIMSENNSLKDNLHLKRHECSEQCEDSLELCAIAQEICEDKAFQKSFSRMVLSIVHDTIAIDRLWSSIMTHIELRRLKNVSEFDLYSCVLSHASFWYAHKSGAQEKWTYSQTRNVSNSLKNIFTKKIGEKSSEKECIILQKLLKELRIRTFDPFPACGSICSGKQPVCLYRHDAANLIASGRFKSVWENAMEADKTSKGSVKTWSVSMDAGNELFEFLHHGVVSEEKIEQNHKAAKRVSLCYAQQKLIHDHSLAPKAALRIINELIKESNHA